MADAVVQKPKIFVFPVRPNPVGDCLYLAIAEDGSELAKHVSSGVGFGKNDMGMGSSIRQHQLYARKYPDGYELVWVDDWTTHPFLSAQSTANQTAGAGQTELDCM